MPTAPPVDVSLDVPSLVHVAESVGAHVGAKLETCHSDERTLTDELCDMISIWASSALPRGPARMRLTIERQSARREAQRGGDLELVVRTPAGAKRALLQAKVIDPDTHRLRGSPAAARGRLQTQLRKAEVYFPSDLVFVLLYVPGQLLDGRLYGFSTWEQQYAVCSGVVPSYMGASLVALTDLKRGAGSWRYRPSFQHLGDLGGPVPHISFCRLLLELICCKRGSWSCRSLAPETRLTDSSILGRDTLTVEVAASEAASWDEVLEDIRSWLKSGRGLIASPHES